MNTAIIFSYLWSNAKAGSNERDRIGGGANKLIFLTARGESCSALAVISKKALIVLNRLLPVDEF